MDMNIDKLIARVFALLPIYEEHIEDEDFISDKIIKIVDDIYTLCYFYENKADKKDIKKISSCADSIVCLNNEPFYSFAKRIVKKVVLDVTGDLGRFKIKYIEGE